MFFLCAVLIALCAAAAALAGVPSLINYQGVLTSGGNPVTTPVNIIFTIWSDSTAGVSFWSEQQQVTPDANGTFARMLGSVTPVPDSAFRALVCHLGIKVGADPEMTPRMPLLSVPYAFRAAEVDMKDGDWSLVGTDTLFTYSNVGIGTSSPTEKLHVNGAIKSGNSIIINGLADEVLTTTGEIYIGKSPGFFSDVEVGIGTHTPTATLHIEGTAYLNGVAKMAAGARLQSEVNGGARILGEQGETPARPAIGFFSTNGVDDGGGGNGIYRPSANRMAFATASTEKMRISEAGVVGIGTGETGTDYTKLQVNGAIATAVSTVTTTTTLTHAASVVLGNNSGGQIWVTLPLASTCKGHQITVKKISPDVDGAVNVQCQGTDAIDIANVHSLNLRYDFVVLVSDGVSHWYIVGK